MRRGVDGRRTPAPETIVPEDLGLIVEREVDEIVPPEGVREKVGLEAHRIGVRFRVSGSIVAMGVLPSGP